MTRRIEARSPEGELNSREAGTFRKAFELGESINRRRLGCHVVASINAEGPPRWAAKTRSGLERVQQLRRGRLGCTACTLRMMTVVQWANRMLQEIGD